MRRKAGKRNSTGYTLVEVLVGIMIFALGMMALAQLQGSLSKSSADASARTVAMNIAEETIERLRSFSQITASETVDAFNNIVSGTETVTGDGMLDYTVTMAVTDYYYNPETESLQTTKPEPDIVNADLKRVQITVSWAVGDAAQNFRIDDENSTTNLGTGSITLIDLISSFTTIGSAKVVLNNVGDGLFAPPVDYNPGQNPDIISIQLGNNKFKESTTPLPDVIRQDELVETRFDVVTYSQNDSGATFLRREEFRAVSCECTLRIPANSEEGGLRPTVWDGTAYTQGEFVFKPYGESASNQQSIYCDLCCRDHHDGGSGSEDQPGDPGRARYNPFRSSTDYHAEGALAGDHKHYWRDRFGNLNLALNDGDTYVEACRMVRKDGFFRIAQDLRQEGLNAFPADFLDETDEVGIYSDYVTAAVSQYEADIGATNQYENDPPVLTPPHVMPTPVVFPASTFANPTEMADNTVTEQQLRSRGVYVDYMSDDLRTKINCLDEGGDGASCEAPDVTSALEIMPFYDVQLTWLARWNETPNNNPIDVSNEAIQDNNLHSRGVATLGTGYGFSIITSSVHTGNLGLTGTDPVDPHYVVDEEIYDLYARAVDYGTPPPLSGIIVKGNIFSSVPGVKAADVEIEANGAACDRTNTGFECNLITGAKSPQIRIYNYGHGISTVLGCSDVLSVQGVEHASEGGSNWTRFDLPLIGADNADIIIRADAC